MNNSGLKSYGWLYAIALLICVAGGAGGGYLLRPGMPHATNLLVTGGALLAASGVGLVAVVATLPIALSMGSSQRLTLKHQEELLASLSDRLQQVTVMMNVLSDQQLLSDKAKQVAYREKDREALRRAIREEVARGDFEAATALVNDMEATFGYRQEAAQIRNDIIGKQHDVMRRRIGEQLTHLDNYLRAEEWASALQEAYRVMQMFPGDEAVQRLPQEIEHRRQARKKQLQDSWHEAVNRHDIDGSIEILKRLDLYLTPAEAEGMQEIARNIFKEKRESLQGAFTTAVKDHNWSEAVRLGDEITSEFPNTRIAQEVRDMMDTLRQRAAEPEGQLAKA